MVSALRIVFIFLLTALCAVLGTLFILINWSIPLSVRWSSQIWSRGILIICNHRLVYRDSDKWPRDLKGIIIANHSSHFDIPVVFLASPVPVFYLAKKELKNIPFLGWYMQLTGMIFIDRSNAEKARESMKKAGEYIRKGRTVISFPEGTRSKTGKLGLFRRGSFQLAQAAGVPVYPLCISGTYEALPPGKFRIRPGRFEAVFCDPFQPEEYQNWTVEEFAAKCRERIEVAARANLNAS